MSSEPASNLEERLVPTNWLDQAPVTRALLALNIGVFVVLILRTAGKALFDLPGPTALEFGGSYALATMGEGRWETLVTACFLHGSVLHLAVNMVVLWLAGPMVERTVGSARMAPMYLVAGAFGNLLSVGYWLLHRSGGSSFGASGAISGVVAAALVVSWRLQGWRGPVTQAMLRWLGFIVVFSVLAAFLGSRIDNAAHVGGAIAGGLIAAMWKRGYTYSERATAWTLAACAGVLLASVGVVAFHDRTDRFAMMNLQERDAFTSEALADGRCRDAHDGLLAVERLRRTLAPVTSLRTQVEATCGHVR